MPSLIPTPYRLVAALAAVLIAWLSGSYVGWTVSGWRWQGRADAAEAAHALALVKAAEAGRDQERQWQRQIAAIDAAGSAQETKDHDEDTRLRAAVDAGAVRLRVAADCPAPGLSQPAVRAGLDYRPGAELAAAARADYFALRDGIERAERKLNACQNVLAAWTRPENLP